VIELLGHEMHGAAMHLDTGSECPGVRVQSRKRRQERRMDVQQATMEAPHESRREDPHESGQRDELRGMTVDRIGEGRFECLARGKLAVRHRARGDTACPRDRQSARVGDIADYRRHREPGIEQRLHVAAAARDEDDH
jgi:hypothetical protein